MNYTKIECSRELPEEKGMYDTNIGQVYFDGNRFATIYAGEINCWYKPLPEQLLKTKTMNTQKEANDFLNEWQKIHNPFYPNRMRWDERTGFELLKAYIESKPLPEQPVDYEGLWEEFVEEDATIDYATFKKLIQQAVAQSSGCVVKLPENPFQSTVNKMFFKSAIESLKKLNPHVKFEQ